MTLLFHKQAVWNIWVFIFRAILRHIQSVVNKSNKTLFMIIRCIFNASFEIKLLAFNTVVHPVLEYASQVWSPHIKQLIEQLETIQRRAVRLIFKLKWLDSMTNCMLENSIEELEIRKQDLWCSFLTSSLTSCTVSWAWSSSGVRSPGMAQPHYVAGSHYTAISVANITFSL